MGVYEALQKLDQTSDDFLMEVVSAVSGRSVDNLLEMPIDEFLALRSEAAFAFGDIPEPKGKLKKEYILGDMHLVPIKAVDDMTAGQYIDYQNLTKRGDAALVPLLSTLLVPKGCKYGSNYDVAEVHKAIREHLSVTDAGEVLCFFVGRLLRSMLDILNSLCRQGLTLRGMMEGSSRKQEKRAMRELRRFLKSGAGCIVSMWLHHPLGEPGTQSSN